MRCPRARLAALAALAFAVGVTACASNSSGARTRGSRDEPIAAEELEKYANEDLYTLIQRIRPTWLQNRAAYTGMGRQPISVIVNGVVQQSGFDAVREFRAADVREVSYMNARDATTFYGTDMSAGAIVILTRR
jgi:hypothetical protein